MGSSAGDPPWSALSCLLALVAATITGAGVAVAII